LARPVYPKTKSIKERNDREREGGGEGVVSEWKKQERRILGEKKRGNPFYYSAIMSWNRQYPQWSGQKPKCLDWMGEWQRKRRLSCQDSSTDFP
jgi:hypothetical protein